MRAFIRRLKTRQVEAIEEPIDAAVHVFAVGVESIAGIEIAMKQSAAEENFVGAVEDQIRIRAHLDLPHAGIVEQGIVKREVRECGKGAVIEIGALADRDIRIDLQACVSAQGFKLPVETLDLCLLRLSAQGRRQQRYECDDPAKSNPHSRPESNTPPCPRYSSGFRGNFWNGNCTSSRPAGSLASATAAVSSGGSTESLMTRS